MKQLVIPFLACAGLVCASAAAQGLASTPGQRATAAASATASDFAALFEDDGELWGAGDCYRARFDRDQVAFHPFLTRHEPVTRELAFTMLSAGRADDLRNVEPSRVRRVQQAERVVTYDRGFVQEVYEIQCAALKQSFVFPRVPAGSGDLVVRCQLNHNLAVLRSSGRELELGAVCGSVVVRDIIGFDAVGKRVVGTMELVDSVLEMRLPEAFVRAATAPITLDPAYSTADVISSGTDFDPDVAYGEENRVWMMVWHREVSANDGDIYARLFVEDGTSQPIDYGINTGSNHNAARARVAYNLFRQRFLFVWESNLVSAGTNRGIRARSLLTTGGTPSSIFDVTSTSDSTDERAVAIGGNRCPTCAAMCIAWDRGNNIQGRTLSLTAAGGLSAASSVTDVGPGNRDNNVDVSDRTVNFPYWWIVFDADTPGFAPNNSNPKDVYATQRNTSMTNVLGTDQYVQFTDAANTLRRYQQPAICGSENHWLVVFAGKDNGGERDLFASTLMYSDVNPTSPNLLTSVPIVTDSGDDEYPEVAWGQDSVLVTWINNNQLHFKTIQPLDCATCEATQQYSSTADFTSSRVASQSSAGVNDYGNRELAMAVYARTGSNDAVVSRMYELADGNVENLGGGCSTAASADVYASCARVGNGSYQASILDVTDNLPVWLVIGVDRFDQGCGSCTLVVDPFTAVLVSTTASADSLATVSIPIPSDASLAGMTFYQQWLMDSGGSNNCGAVGLDFSDCLKVKIQQ